MLIAELRGRNLLGCHSGTFDFQRQLAWNEGAEFLVSLRITSESHRKLTDGLINHSIQLNTRS